MINRAILLLLLMLLTCIARAQDPDLLEPEKAFRISARLIDAGRLEVNYEIAPGYYMYRDKFKFAAEPTSVALDASKLPAGQSKKDAIFGNVQIYRGSLKLELPVSGTDPGAPQFLLKAVSQGCADIGVCYPPLEQKVSVKPGVLSGELSNPGVAAFVEPS